ncbi:PadR family transcriptional regulator [Agromyces badenianii]|uniref:PadR family transcriptional regulator n=1 Tax=Agromyces badenianii TaxID=2080742 RepID=A0A2S0WT07_9MICO|nr:PadR family transcriptional regulator [Agromyces badenianii]AWB94469.1 PadR family transcriptional regulator [Agromyces badenianii]
MEPIQRVTPPTLDVLVALVESASPMWGLQIIKDSGRNPGTVYPILERLESLGWLTSDWPAEPERSGPRRHYYELTAEGRKAAVKLLLERAGSRVRSSDRGAVLGGAQA